ncbi:MULTISPECIES: threonine/serine exporter family protein [Sulfurospirillum]|uniref:threonine/serine exporter family protein n=1 Tax=Sulfurospirillum TaxID=57665 RepID=UPI000541FD5D|nr:MULTISPECIES: threonine/serine exporter family protein [Sulfurospirillum]KHG33353.1 MAG: membrane protein [Sulfurospirillum sp. MES]
MEWMSLLLDALWAAIPAVGFAMIFNVPRSALPFCAAGGALTYGLRDVLMHAHLSIELSTFIAATTIGIIGVFWSRRYVMPRPVYTVASIIPMIPGTYAYEMMISLVRMNTEGVSDVLLSRFIENGLHAVSILFAIAFGLVLPSMYYTKRKQPII